MTEMWLRASESFKKINESVMDADQVCPCLLDEASNGIVEALDMFAVSIRGGDPSRQVGGKRGRKAFRPVCYWCYCYWCWNRIRSASKSRSAREDASTAVQSSVINSHLTDSASWEQWKAFFSDADNDQMGFDFAHYMYCKIHSMKNP